MSKLNIIFSPYEDRLILRADRGEHGKVTMLMTRRMVIIVLQQLLGSLPALTGLNKTPTQYWQEVLQMTHQQAMQAKRDTDNAQLASASEPAAASKSQTEPQVAPEPPAIYLATELTVQLADKAMTLAFKGLPMPRAMTIPSAHVPVFATLLQTEHVHQLIQLLITKSHEAQWHLPVALPWLENPKPQDTTLGEASVH